MNRTSRQYPRFATWLIDNVRALSGPRQAAAWKELPQFLRYFMYSVVLPALVVTSLVAVLAWRTGVILPASWLAATQEKSPNIVTVPGGGLGRYAAYKLARVREQQPEIVYIGQSRCNEARSGMFKPYRMYNACLTAWTVDQTREMMERVLKVSSPTTIIFELDYFMFTEAYRSAWSGQAKMNFHDFAPLDGFEHLSPSSALAELRAVA